MKTIEITDEMYNSLIELSKEVKTQHNGGLATPYIFQIKTMEEVCDNNGDKYWLSDDTLISTEEDIRYAIFEWKEWDEDNLEDVEKYDNLDEYEIDDIMQENYTEVYLSEEARYENAFLTRKACQEHINKNSYHYRKPTAYQNTAFRNNEMELIFNFLKQLQL